MTKRQLKSNIRAVMQRVTADDIYAGALWYKVAFDETQRLAESSGLAHRTVINALAVLSPGQRWKTALKGTERLLEARRDGTLDTVTLPGYPRNVQKAKDIVSGRPYVMSGPKVTAFAENIANHGESTRVTVDVHAYSVAAGRRYTIKEMPSITQKMYELISAAYVEIGKEFGLSGLQCQAVTWIWWRREMVGSRYN